MSNPVSQSPYIAYLQNDPSQYVRAENLNQAQEWVKNQGDAQLDYKIVPNEVYFSQVVTPRHTRSLSDPSNNAYNLNASNPNQSNINANLQINNGNAADANQGVQAANNNNNGQANAAAIDNVNITSQLQTNNGKALLVDIDNDQHLQNYVQARLDVLNGDDVNNKLESIRTDHGGTDDYTENVHRAHVQGFKIACAIDLCCDSPNFKGTNHGYDSGSAELGTLLNDGNVKCFERSAALAIILSQLGHDVEINAGVTDDDEYAFDTKGHAWVVLNGKELDPTNLRISDSHNQDKYSHHTVAQDFCDPIQQDNIDDMDSVMYVVDRYIDRFKNADDAQVKEQRSGPNRPLIDYSAQALSPKEF